jgi:glycosyltransferase involved in cell wall biosynthesis
MAFAQGTAPLFRPAERSPGRRYVLITPCRNEAAYLQATLDSIASQSLLPALWVVVDDGSSDETPALLARAAASLPYLRVVRREDRGARAVGPGVVEAFYDGLARIDLDDFDFVCKLDADLELPRRYFERAIERMERDPYLGNLSGKLFAREADGRIREERTGDENAVGPAKLYRVECFREIGGFVREVSWDGIDGHLCRMNGWIAASVHDPELRIVHLRPMGSSQENIRVGRRRWGRGKYFMGSALHYVVASAAYRLLEPPRLVGGASILLGYVEAALGGHSRYDNPEYRRYLRRFERNQLLLGKRRALERENRRVRRSGPPKARAVSAKRDAA